MNIDSKSLNDKTELLLNIRSYLFYLLPRGTFRGDKFYVGDVHGNKGKSLVVELSGSRAGLWNDFATGEGGDIIDLWAAVHRKNARTEFPEVIASISEWLGNNKKYREKQYVDEDFEKFITHSWNYYDENGQVIVKVYRSDPPGKKKVYKPFDVKQSKFAAPEIRPLYNIPEILKSDKVILVEGEKCAEALIEQGIVATTTMSGANADVDKTDWSPLKGKHIIIWPDNDEAGNKYAKNAEKKLLEIGVESLVILNIPQNKTKGWDAAECVLEGIRASEFIERRLKKNDKLNILDWNLSRYLGEVPTQKFLVEGLFPLGVTSIVAAMGDTGKGMLLLDLALKVASDTDQICGFGSLVKEHGSVVIFSAEDDADEIHRRLERLDPEGNRAKYQDRVFIVPMPNTGGPFSIIKTNTRGKCPETSEKFEGISEQLNAIENLKLIIFDPLVSFVHADINSDPELGWYSTGLLASLATETGATVIAAHHMRKPKCGSITTVEQARDAIRGTTALVDGVRCSFALWPALVEHQNSVCNTLKLERTHSKIYQGAVVKSNGAADRSVRTYLRSSTGLLEDISEQINAIKSSDEELKNILIHYIKLSAHEGHPFTHTGGPGIFKQRHKLPPMFHNVSRHKLERLVQSLLNDNRVVKGMAADSKEDKWLDVPTGPFARGEGKFKLGAGKFKVANSL
ncbi:MAG: AAA family ATPase [Wolbachia endosymbiont of Andrena praecox]|nr:AAA family ATPase [Wolbachia endosymbiont of Andrena praecox]MDX5498255.1 AAA family ATPase [Wolbachia endosymbiont of Lasioglossum nitidulum]MDX5561271.1 AAA family ATPase [Wolbachia endosymbiont of Andrena bicolor]